MPFISRVGGSYQSDSSARKREFIRRTTSGGGGAGPLTITLSSTSFAHNATIPNNYRTSITGQCNGLNTSPQLSWVVTGDDSQVATWRLRCIDPQGGDWIHWSVDNIPKATTSIAENGTWPGGVTVNQTSFTEPGDPADRVNGWNGPCPPPDFVVHNYQFTITAVNSLGVVIQTSNTYTGIAEF